MAASASASATQPADHHHRTTGTDAPRGANKHHRRPLEIQVPANSGWFGRPSGPASAPCGRAHAHNAADGHGRHGADRPAASPSLLRSPSAWIRAKGQSFGSSKHAHRRSGNFHYDAISYAHNFDEGGGEEDAPPRHACFSPRIPTAASQPASPSSSSGPGTRGGNNDGNGQQEPAAARETAGRGLD